jgi:two-component system, OmpR family, sensor kinase
MTLHRSLRWKLLAWYALVIGGLAAAFGALLDANVRRSINREIDARLRSQTDALARVIIPIGAGKYQVELTGEQVAAFREEGAGASHYAIWTDAGRAIDESHPELAIPPPTADGNRDRGPFREWSRRGPDAVWVLVGEDVSRQRNQLRHLRTLAVGAGVTALAMMLAGGWFLTGRALAPVNRISRAAAAISASNLSERIDVSRMETELADLADSINSAFDRLQRAFEQQTRFTADASHELRTPLSIVLSQADLALKQPRSADEYRQTIEAVHRAGERMRGVVEGLLTLARADGGQIRLNEERFDLQDLVDETCRMLQPLAASKEVVVAQRLAASPVRGDRDRLGEAVANILSNAIRYNVPGGRVDVTLDGDAAEVHLRVADTGRGIPDAEREFIFDRFYRVDQARSRSVDGSGLGLAITKWIIDAHGGSITCHARDPVGTVFEVKLKRLNPSV